MRNLVLHLQTQCLCLQPHQKRAQEILWEEFYTKAIYSTKCSLIADNYDLGQRCMAETLVYQVFLTMAVRQETFNLLRLSRTRPLCSFQTS